MQRPLLKQLDHVKTGEERLETREDDPQSLRTDLRVNAHHHCQQHSYHQEVRVKEHETTSVAVQVV